MIAAPKRLPTAFEPELVTLPLTKIVPLKQVKFDGERNPACRRIAASLKRLGLIEPLVVYRQKGRGGTYLLLEGHVRLEAFKAEGVTEALCLVATDDEAYTYNHKVNRVSPIQEHFMILKAVEEGVPEEELATTLSVDVGSIRAKRDLLKGVCPEVVLILKDKRVSPAALREIRKAQPMRQIEIAELMVMTHTFSASYARAMLAVTAPEQLADPDKAKATKGLTPEDVARMERETEHLERDFRALEDTHGKNVLNLVIASSYVLKLLESAAVVRFLAQRHADVLGEFQRIAESTALESPEQATRRA